MSRQVYNPGKRNAVLSGPTLESRYRREAQIQDHRRLGELRDHPGDLADLHLRYATCFEALSIEALGPAVLPGHGRKRSAHDLLPYEYNAVLRRAMRILPYTRYLTPLREDPRYFLPLGTAYALFGLASIALLIAA